jgi:hypothetical protein
MFNLFSRNKTVKRDQESQKRLEDFRRHEKAGLDGMLPLIESIKSYDKDLGRRKPKEFWIDGRQVRIFLGKKTHDTNYDVYEEIIWVHYEVASEDFHISHFRGQRGRDKEKETLTLEDHASAFAHLKDSCDSYFAQHVGD